MGSMDGKVALVTGAASGIGKATVGGLAQEGGHVVLLVRSKERGDAAMAQIRATQPAAKLELLFCDLASQESIRAAAKEFMAKHPKLDVLVNAAGVFRRSRQLTKDGIEETFATNVLAYFLLTNLLHPALKAAAPSRVINVSSRYASGAWVAKIDFDDLQSEKGKFTTMRATPPTMVARVLFTQELAERWRPEGIAANVVHPGLVRDTRLLLDVGGPFRWITNTFGASPSKGADTIVWLASAPEAAAHTGKMWEKRKVVKTPGQGSDPAARRRLWEESLRLTKLA